MRSFLTRINSEASQKDELIRLSQAELGRVQDELRAARSELERRARELEQLRTLRQEESRLSGERVAALTDQLLRDKIATSIEEVRQGLESQYQGRIAQLERVLLEKEDALTTAREQHRQALAEASSAHQAEIAELARRHAAGSAAVDTVAAEVRAQITTLYEERLRKLEQEAAESRRAADQAKQELATGLAEAERAHDDALAKLEREHAAKQQTLDALVEHARQQLAALYEERLHKLERETAESRQAAVLARQELVSGLAETERAHRDALAKLAEQHAAEKTTLDDVVSSAREQMSAAHRAAVANLQDACVAAVAEGRREKQRADALQQELDHLKARVAADLAAAQASLSALHEQRVRKLDATIAHHMQLLEQANVTITTLQEEVHRARAAAAAEQKLVRDDYESRLREQEQQLVALRDGHAQLKAYVAKLERILGEKDDAKYLKQLEDEREMLQLQDAERAQRLGQLTEALTVLRDVCKRSTAVRSLIAGVNKAIDLDQLFVVLDE